MNEAQTEAPSVAHAEKVLRILVVEEEEDEVRQLVNHITAAGYRVDWTRVSSAEELELALTQDKWDVILVAQRTMTLSARDVIPKIVARGFDGPLLVVSGGPRVTGEAEQSARGSSGQAGAEEEVAELMRAGAHDYIRRGRLTRLVPAIERELEQARLRAQHRRTLEALCQSEERYRTLWESSPEAILLVDRSGTITFGNLAVYHTFGYPPEQLHEHHISDLINVSVERLERAVLESSSSGRPVQNAWTGRDRAGRELDLLVTVAEIPLGEQTYFVLFVRDMTEYKRMIQALEAKKQELEIARRIQRKFLPSGPLQLPGLHICGETFPAEETGGDLLDYFELEEGRVIVVIGDVSGHGMGPALVMAEVHACVRLAATVEHDPAKLLSRVNQALGDDLMRTGRLVTTLLLVIDRERNELVYSSAGHPKGYIFGAKGEVKHVLESTGRPLGLFKSYTCPTGGPIRLQEGDLIFLCTDGLTEAIGPDRGFFGDTRVVQYLQEHIDLPCEQIIQGLEHEVERFRGGAPQIDDITIALIRVTEKKD